MELPIRPLSRTTSNGCLVGMDCGLLGKQMMDALAYRVLRTGIIEVMQQPLFLVVLHKAVFMQEQTRILAHRPKEHTIVLGYAACRVLRIQIGIVFHMDDE